jgi:hypothetical protein
MTLETPLWIQQGRFPSYADRTLLTSLVSTNGIPDQPPDNPFRAPASGDLLVSVATQTPPAVSVAPGTCYIGGADQTRQGPYVCRSTDSVTVALDARPASNSRIDLIYARLIDSSAGAPPWTASDGTVITDGWYIDKLTGAVAAAPVEPAPTQPASYMRLAAVTVPSGSGAITVADRRVRATSRVAQPRATPAPPQGVIAYAQGGSGTMDYGPSWGVVVGLYASLTVGRYYMIGGRYYGEQVTNAGQVAIGFQAITPGAGWWQQMSHHFGSVPNLGWCITDSQLIFTPFTSAGPQAGNARATIQMIATATPAANRATLGYCNIWVEDLGIMGYQDAPELG